MKKRLLKLIRFYITRISPHLPPRCKYYPTCSSYMYTAIERFGVIRGGLLGLIRLSRCNIFFPGGYDPVPEKTEVRHHQR